MFAIFLSKSMDPFYQNISSFPSAIFTVLLVVCALYWAGAVVGLMENTLAEFKQYTEKLA